jgi:predicted regulator of Ras-like GTPase activity (Roadblock/LC7/MglB family)
MEQDLRRLLDSKGVVGAFLISKNGEIVAQVFQETVRGGEDTAPYEESEILFPVKKDEGAGRRKESEIMPLVKKVIPLMQSMKNMPLRRTVFETTKGSVIFCHTENGAIGCILGPDFDIVSIMLEVHTAGEMICSHLNNVEPDKQMLDHLLAEHCEEFRVRNAELLTQIERHLGRKITEDLIKRTVKVKK